MEIKWKEEQVQKVRTSNAEKFQLLELAIQEKLEQASSRRAQLELEQKEKLRNYVSILQYKPHFNSWIYFYEIINFSNPLRFLQFLYDCISF